MAYEIAWAEDLDEDFTNARLSTEEVGKIILRIKKIAEAPNPITQTERVMNTDLRKLRIGNHRLFLHIDTQTEMIYGLAYLDRKNCYKKGAIRKTISTWRKMSKTITNAVEDEIEQEYISPKKGKP